MTYEERQILRQRISEIQIPKEKRARQKRLTTLYGEMIYMGGDSLPKDKQSDGYPTSRLYDD